MIIKNKYWTSHNTFVVSSKRIELSPYIKKT